jgi:hypothetical protein
MTSPVYASKQAATIISSIPSQVTVHLKILLNAYIHIIDLTQVRKNTRVNLSDSISIRNASKVTIDDT